MLDRREALISMLGALAACAAPSSSDGPSVRPLPSEQGAMPPRESTDDALALLDTLVPSDPGVPGALEARVLDVLEDDDFGRLAFERGFLPALPPPFRSVRAALNAELARLAFPARFAELPRERREALIEGARLEQPLFEALRAACFFAWLGGYTNDLGLRAIGFPPFEDVADGLATRGFDDYSYGIAPMPSLELGLDDDGDLP